MLFGDYPFYALDMNSLLSKIKKGSGDNLKFPLDKNKISNYSKDLLRCLLQDDPDRRIDWETFFKHPLFNEKKADAISDSHKGLLVAMGKVMKSSIKVDQAFE